MARPRKGPSSEAQYHRIVICKGEEDGPMVPTMRLAATKAAVVSESSPVDTQKD